MMSSMTLFYEINFDDSVSSDYMGVSEIDPFISLFFEFQE